MPSDSDPPIRPPVGEKAVWKAIDGAWRPLFGSFAERGISIEWHDFQLERNLAWSPSFHPGSLEICLNFSGAAHFHDGTAERELPAGYVAAYTARQNAPLAERRSGSWHRFLTIELSPSFLRAQCNALDHLKPPVRRFIEGAGQCPPFLEIHPMTTALLGFRSAFIEPPLSSSARDAWFLAKTLEVLAHTVFNRDEPNELFCQKHHRQNHDRVERARYLLERDLENPPTLEMLAEDVGCSTFHLSRIFAGNTGMSIPKFLRTRRIERAADLLLNGRMNVTEAAMAVGYSSLSAFNKAFVEQMGCCPGLYPALKIAKRNGTK
jgi:AraC family transcriptional regulator